MSSVKLSDCIRLWRKDGVKVLKTDQLHLAVDGDDDYHPENKSKLSELQAIRDGEIVARIWWIR